MVSVGRVARGLIAFSMVGAVLGLAPREALAQHAGAPSEHGARRLEDSAQPQPSRPEDYEEEFAEYRFHVGVGGTVLWRLGEGEASILSGGGLTFNVTIIPNHFEIELVGTALLADHANGWEVPIDLLAMFPFEVNRNLAFYVGVGPTISPYSLRQESGVLYGLATAVGFDFLIQRRGGFFLEVNYNLLAGSEGRILHDIGFGAGPTFGF